MNEVAAKIQPSKWKRIAIQLGLSENEIDINNDVEDCFSRTFDTWEHIITEVPLHMVFSIECITITQC